MDQYKLFATVVVLDLIIALALSGTYTITTNPDNSYANFTNNANILDQIKSVNDQNQGKLDTDAYAVIKEGAQDPSGGGFSYTNSVSGIVAFFQLMTGKIGGEETLINGIRTNSTLQGIAIGLFLFTLLIHLYAIMKLDAIIRRRDVT